jgi:hypothetical protein
MGNLSNNIIPEIRNWHMWKSNTGNVHISGSVYNSIKFPDGSLISTTRVINSIEDELGFELKTLNSIYYCDNDEFDTFGYYSLKETRDALNSIN